jgi:hypothetical protein
LTPVCHARDRGATAVVARDPWIDPEFDIVDAFVERAMGADVATVVIGGKIVVEDHQPRTIELKGSIALPTAPLTPARTPAENHGFSTYERIPARERFAPDSPLEGTGFEPVWAFPVK